MWAPHEDKLSYLWNSWMDWEHWRMIPLNFPSCTGDPLGQPWRRIASEKVLKYYSINTLHGWTRKVITQFTMASKRIFAILILVDDKRSGWLKKIYLLSDCGGMLYLYGFLIQAKIQRVNWRNSAYDKNLLVLPGWNSSSIDDRETIASIEKRTFQNIFLFFRWYEQNSGITYVVVVIGPA